MSFRIDKKVNLTKMGGGNTCAFIDVEKIQVSRKTTRNKKHLQYLPTPKKPPSGSFRDISKHPEQGWDAFGIKNGTVWRTRNSSVFVFLIRTENRIFSV